MIPDLSFVCVDTDEETSAFYAPTAVSKVSFLVITFTSPV
jgi:hypothetical protein